MTSRYGRPVELGISLVPNRADLDQLRALARRADELGLDLVGIQDHPYQWRYLETWSLIGDAVARVGDARRRA
jgi:alkanesulfonate monooxygenase SsuD/methylene tetrahydromethanopterin reductase-like flavin-dependent oxidoreductase (luciferase family)